MIYSTREDRSRDENISKCRAFISNLGLIWNSLKHEVLYKTMIFFLFVGLFLPCFEDLQYYFVIDECGLTQDQFDFL